MTNKMKMCFPVMLTNRTLGYTYTNDYELPSKKKQFKILRNAKYAGFNIIELNTGRYGRVIRYGRKMKFSFGGKIIKMSSQYDYDKYCENVHCSINPKF